MLLKDDEIYNALATEWGIKPEELPRKRIPGSRIIAKAQAKKIFDELERHVYATFPESKYVYIPVEIWQQFGKEVEDGT